MLKLINIDSNDVFPKLMLCKVLPRDCSFSFDVGYWFLGGPNRGKYKPQSNQVPPPVTFERKLRQKWPKIEKTN